MCWVGLYRMWGGGAGLGATGGLGFCCRKQVEREMSVNVSRVLLTMTLYAPRMAAVMMPRNRPMTLSTTEAQSRRYRWITSQQLLTPVNS
ncbi:hypothetical protein INR49_016329 [Caranx melampygus]|nr:hypothetical protein INR49_016329 [Caranx melampygus]